MGLTRHPLRLFSVLVLLLALAFGATILQSPGSAEDEQKGFLAGLISKALSTSSSHVSIGEINGALSSDATIKNIEIADRDGVWLKLNKARINWRRLALFQGRLEIDKLDIDQLDVLRKPVPAATVVSDDTQPLLPYLPVKVQVKEFSLATLNLGELVLGLAASFSAGGSADLGPPSEGLQLSFDAQRLDRPASLIVRLNLVPKGELLNLKVALDEPAGGFLAHLASLPGHAPVKLNVDGNGTLDAFKSNLIFEAGEGIGAKGEADLERVGASRRLGLRMDAEISGLLPPAAAPLFAGTTKLSGGILFADDGSLSINAVTLTAAAARLEIAGSVSAAHDLDIQMSAANVPNGADGTQLQDVKIRHLALDTHITGAFQAPSINAMLVMQDTNLPELSLGDLHAHFNAKPDGSLTDSKTRLQFTGDVKVGKLMLKDAALDRAIGSEARFSMRGSVTTQGLVDFETLEISSPSISASYKGLVGPAKLNGHISAEAPDLSRFDLLAKLALKGRANLSAELEGVPRSSQYSASIDAKALEFSTGVAAVDGLAAGKLSLHGGMKIGAGGSFGFNDLTLAGTHASAKIDGSSDTSSVNIKALAAVPDLSKADKRLTGKGEITGTLTGTLAEPDANGKILLSNATMLGRPVPQLELLANATHLRDAPEIALALDGEVDRKPAKGALRITLLQQRGIGLNNLDISIGSAALKGAASLDKDNYAAGKLSLHAGDLNDLSALMLQQFSGSIDADVTLTRQDLCQNVVLNATSKKIEGFGIAIDKASANLLLHDIYKHPLVDGHIVIDQARVENETISRLSFDAKGQGTTSNVEFKAVARGFDVEAKALLQAAAPVRLDVSQFEASRGHDKIALSGPATISVKSGGADISHLSFNLNGGRVLIDGHVGSQLDLKANARTVPLSIANLFAPDLGLGGVLDGQVAITGSMSNLGGTYHFKVAKLTSQQTANAGLPPADVAATGQLESGRTTLEGSVAADSAGSLRVNGTLPLDTNGTFDLKTKGNINLSFLNQNLSTGGRSVKGTFAIDGRLAGTLAQPQVFGTGILSNGGYQDALLGLRLDAAQARLNANGAQVTVETASATTPDGGSLRASGSIKADPAAGYPGIIKLQGQRAHLMANTLANVVSNLNLDLTGPLARNPRLSGTIGIIKLDVPVPDSLPQNLLPLPGTRHIDPTATARARLALAAKARLASGVPAFDPALDLTIDTQGKILVHGRGLNAQLGGSLKLTGSLSMPHPEGSFHLIQGNFQILSSQLDFTRANLAFAGDFSPQLDFLASTQSAGASINVAITGNSSDPQFAFTSSPDLPQDEIISRLLFGQESGQLSPTQALALAQAVAIYSGGNSAFEEVRRSLGLGSSNGSDDALSKLLGDRISFGLRTGATPSATGVGVDLRIYKQLKAKGAIDSTGNATVGAGAEFEW